MACRYMSMRQLPPCLSSPNCVSTQAQDEGHTIAPAALRLKGSRLQGDSKFARLPLWLVVHPQ